MFDRNGERKYLNWPEREMFFRAVQEEPAGRRRVFCLALFYTGCRLSELLNLRWEHIDLTGKSLVFRTLKQRERIHHRSVPVPDRLLEELAGLQRPEDGRQRVWPWSRATGYRVVRRAMRQAELKGIRATPKGLRHSFAVACISRGIPLTTVRKWMGHARLETTAIYLDFIGEEEREQARLLWKSI